MFYNHGYILLTVYTLRARVAGGFAFAVQLNPVNMMDCGFQLIIRRSN
jgi:hypothetical protein